MGIIEAATVTLITMTIIVTKITISITRRLHRRPEGEAGSRSRWVALDKLLYNLFKFILVSCVQCVWLWHSVPLVDMCNTRYVY